MSKTIDERVVSMQFDNKQFESNVQTSLSTLDKLKRSLNLTGASKGLENLTSAANKVDMSGLASGVEKVGLKFSALEVMGVTALANITNSAVNAGKRIVSALTIDPIKTGLSEYETKINAIQVIKANTRGKNDMNDITAALDDLNDYADKTIYNFAQMTNNVGKFVAQGLDVEKASKAVQGMANLAGASGASAEDMARATYQMSQALGGTIRKIDWNSLRNANMATVELKNTLTDLARVKGIDIDAMIKDKGTFEDTLEKGWLTGDLFTEAMNIYSDVYSEAELKAMGFNDKQVANFKDLAKMASEATTEVKTFSQLFDVLKETAQSGWTQTWELIIGDFDTAKKMLTGLQVYFSGILDKMSDARNFIIEGVMNITKPWKEIMKKLDGAGLGSIKKAAKSVENITDKVKYFQKVVDKVWRGDFFNSDTGRFELLEKAGYDHRVVQDLVNKGADYKLTIDDIEKSHKKFGLTMDKTSKSTKKTAETYGKLTDKQLEKAGLTKQEINLYRDLEAEAARTGVTINELVDKMSKKDGRTLLIDSIKNAWSGVVGIFKAVKQAWENIFPPVSIVRIYNIIDAINKFSEKLRLTTKKTGELTETGKKLQRVFEGIFAAIDVAMSIAGAVFKPVLTIVKALAKALGVTGGNILDIAANVGDAIVAFRNWLDQHNLITKVVETVVPLLVKMGKAVVDFVKAIYNMPEVQEALGKVSKAFERIGEIIDQIFGPAIRRIKEIIKSITSLDELEISDFVNAFNAIKDVIKNAFGGMPKDIFDGFIKGIKDEAGNIFSAIGEVITKFIEKAKEILGIHSPSTVFKAIGQWIMEGWAAGLKDGVSGIWEFIKETAEKIADKFKEIGENIIKKAKEIGNNIKEFFSKVDWGALFVAGFSTAIIATIVRITNMLNKPLSGLGDMFEGLGDAFEGLGKKFKADALKKKSDAIKNIAIAIGILAASVYVLAKVHEGGSLWPAIGAIGALAVVIGLLVGVAALGGKKSETDMAKLTVLILGFSVAMVILAKAAKKMGKMGPEEFGMAAAGMIILIATMMVLMKSINSMDKDTISSLTILKSMAKAMLIMAIVAKIIGTMEPDEMGKAAIGIAYFVLVIRGLIWATKTAGKDIDKVGDVIMKVSAAMLLLTITAKIIGGMEPGEMGKAAAGILFLGGIITGLIYATKWVSGKDLTKVGSTILAVSGAMMLLGITARVVAGMTVGEIGKAIWIISVFAAIVVGLIAATKLVSEKDLTKVGLTILLVSVAIGILAGVAVLLGMLDLPHLAKGIAAVTFLGVIMAGLIAATGMAKNCKGELIVLTVAIAVLAAAVAGLSLIKFGNLASATASLGLLMGMFAVILKAAGSAQKSLGVLIVMTVAIGLIAGIIYMLAKLPIESTMSSVIAMSALMGAMSLTLIILSAIGKNVTSALLGVLGLAALAVPMFLFIKILEQMNGIQNAAANVLLLTQLMLAMTLVMVPLTAIGMFGPACLIGIASLLALIVAIGGFAVGVGALMDKFPQLEEFLNKGLPVLDKIAYAMGSFIGNIVGGFLGGMSKGFAEIGTNLSLFMMNAMPFITGARMIDENVLTGVKNLGKVILIMTGAEFVNDLANFLTGGSSFATLGTELSKFMMNAMPFITGARLISPEVATSTKNLAEAVLALTKADFIDSITSWIGGSANFSEFGIQLVAFGSAMVAFSKTVAGNINEEAVSAAASAGKLMAELQSSLASTGGVVQWFMGEKDLATFGQQLKLYGEGVAAFSKVVSAKGAINPEAIEAAKNVGSMMLELQNGLEPVGGVVQWFTGTTGLDTFGEQLKLYGAGVAEFSKSISGDNGISPEAVETAKNAGLMMAEVQAAIPEDKWFDGKISLDDFGGHLKKFGEGLKGFSEEIVDVDPTKVTNSADAASRLATLAQSITGVDGESISSFTKVKDVGKAIGKYSENVADINSNTINISITSAEKLLALVKSMAGLDSSGVTNFLDAVNTLGKTKVKDFIKAFKDAKVDMKPIGANLIAELIAGINSKDSSLLTSSSKLISAVIKKIGNEKDEFKTVATKLMDKFISGISKYEDDASTAAKDVVKKALNKAKDYYDDFYSAGKDLGDGLVEGIESKEDDAYDAGYALGQAAVQGEKDGQQSKSPSKLTIKAGKWFGEGLVIGIQKMGSKVYNAGHDLGDSAVSSVSSAISRISEAVNSDVDTQPTIRPVLDLSDVRSGAGAIGSLLNANGSVGISANVGAISTMMNRRNQNGANSDVIDALKDLKKTISSSSGNSYNINGVSYSEGDDVADAIKTIVRAVRIEGRA